MTPCGITTPVGAAAESSSATANPRVGDDSRTSCRPRVIRPSRGITTSSWTTWTCTPRRTPAADRRNVHCTGSTPPAHSSRKTSVKSPLWSGWRSSWWIWTPAGSVSGWLCEPDPGAPRFTLVIAPKDRIACRQCQAYMAVGLARSTSAPRFPWPLRPKNGACGNRRSARAPAESFACASRRELPSRHLLATTLRRSLSSFPSSGVTP